MANKRNTKGNNRRKRIAIALMLSFILILGAAAAVFFLLGQNSDGKRQYEEAVRQETGAFTERLIGELDQIDTSNDEINKADAEIPEVTVTEAEKKMLELELSKLNDERDQQVLKTLTAAYSQTLQAQKQKAIELIEALVAQGKADWADLVAKGENTAANKGLLASEYLAKSRILEGQMDASFQTLMDKMEAQLRAEGFDPAPIIKEYEAEYKRIKEENRKAFMNKALSAIKN